MDAQRPILCVSSLLSLRHPTPSRLLVNDSLAQLDLAKITNEKENENYTHYLMSNKSWRAKKIIC